MAFHSDLLGFEALGGRLVHPSMGQPIIGALPVFAIYSSAHGFLGVFRRSLSPAAELKQAADKHLPQPEASLRHVFWPSRQTW